MLRSGHERCSGEFALILGFPGVKSAARGIRSMLGPRKTLNVQFVPRRPHPERLAKYTSFMHTGGARQKVQN